MTADDIAAMGAHGTDDPGLPGCIYRTFITDDGKTTLMWILDQCGFFQTDKSKIDPSLIAFAGRLMKAGNMGISGDAGAFASAVLSSYRRNDA